MQNSPLYICDGDGNYLEKISGYIMKKQYSPFIVKTINGVENLKVENMKEGILLISSSLLREDMQTLDEKRTIVLSDGELKREFGHFTVISKYQSAAVIYQQLLQYQMDREDIIPVTHLGTKRRGLKIIGVYSPIKRIGKTMFARKMCSERGGKEKVLYISLEEFAKGNEEGIGLSEVIYYFKQDRINLIFEMPDMIRHKQSYDYILPVHSGFDLKDMSAEDWISLLVQIEQTGIYDSVWIDFDTMSPGLELFEKCEEIYMPYIDNAVECRRVEQFEKMIEMMPEYGIKEKIIKILMGG